MPALYSSRPIAFSDTIDGSTGTSLYAGITGVVGAAGWTGTAITGGIEYVIQSPQMLSDGSHPRAKVRIWLAPEGWAGLGTLSTVHIQFAGYVGGSGAGAIHWLRPFSGSTFMTWANACSLAIARLGTSRDYPVGGTDLGYGGTAFLGGIPFVAKDSSGCGLDQDLPPLFDTWFTSGDVWENPGSHPDRRESFRNSVRTDAQAASSSLNGVVLTPAIATALPFPNWTYTPPEWLVWVPGQITGFIWQNARMRWWNPSATVANPVYYSPMVGWGTAADVYPRVQGTMYDSLIISVGQDIDATLTLTDDTETVARRYYNYTFDKDTPRNGHDVNMPNSQNSLFNFHGSLLLLKETAVTGAGGNVAY